jgi:hypothetical protein
MLMEALKQMGAGGSHPLERAAFEPFHEDFNAIRAHYKALKQDVEALGAGPSEEAQEDLTSKVNDLLKQIYAYISWGVRHQVDTELEVDRTLEALGFRVPRTAGYRLFDIVVPAVVLVAAISMIYSVVVDLVTSSAITPYKSVVYALQSAMVHSLMYGLAVVIALSSRAARIEQKTWRGSSARSLAPIAIRAGLVTWGVIVLTTVLWAIPETWRSLVGLMQLVKLASQTEGADAVGVAAWSFLPTRAATALPWLLVGATTGVLLVRLMEGDVRRTEKSHRMRDGLVLGMWLGAAAAAAQLIQTSLAASLGESVPSLVQLPIAGVASFASGFVIGYFVPQAFRANLNAPFDVGMGRKLRELVRQAEVSFGTKAAAADWAFTLHNELCITPAEAIQFQGYATGVWRLLESDAFLRRQEAHPDRVDRPVPVVIKGGLGSGSHAA